MQKGYTPFIHLSGVKMQIVLAYHNDISGENEYSSALKLSLNDAWIKLATKWDRTSLKIGNFSLPFGHNPKVDPDYSIIPNIGGTDLGLSRDFGLLFKTPITEVLDLELALTSGGLLKKPIMTGQLIDEKNGVGDDWLDFPGIKYQGDWLFTFRLGSPVFKRNEYGLVAFTGRMTDASTPGNTTWVYRLGFDWIHKNKEHFRLTNQLLMGPSVSDVDGLFYKIIQQSNAEFFLLKQWIFSVTNNFQFISYENDSLLKGAFASGAAFAVNPHTRIKLNVFSEYNITDRHNEFGLFLQFVTGFGLRE